VVVLVFRDRFEPKLDKLNLSSFDQVCRELTEARQPTMNTFGWTMIIQGTIGDAGWLARTIMAAQANAVAGSWDSIEVLGWISMSLSVRERGFVRRKGDRKEKGVIVNEKGSLSHNEPINHPIRRMIISLPRLSILHQPV